MAFRFESTDDPIVERVLPVLQTMRGFCITFAEPVKVNEGELKRGEDAGDKWREWENGKEEVEERADDGCRNWERRERYRTCRRTRTSSHQGWIRLCCLHSHYPPHHYPLFLRHDHCQFLPGSPCCTPSHRIGSDMLPDDSFDHKHHISALDSRRRVLTLPQRIPDVRSKRG